METERAGRIDAMATGYDDFSDMLGRRGRRLDPAIWDDLVDRLAGHDVTHLGGGSGAARAVTSVLVARALGLMNAT